MSNLYNEFEEKFKFSWFSAGWVEADEPKKAAIESEIESHIESRGESQVVAHKKDLDTLEMELELIKDDIEGIAQKQLQLKNLAKFYK